MLTFVSFFFSRLAFPRASTFSTFSCFFMYLVETHVLTLVSTSSVFQCVSSLRCLLHSIRLCCVLFQSAKFLSLSLFSLSTCPLVFCPFFFTLPPFHVSVFHSTPFVHSCSYSDSLSPLVIHIPSRLHSILFFFIPFLSTSDQFNMYCSALFHSVPSHFTPLLPIPFHDSTFHSIPTPFHSTTLQCCPFRFIPFQAIPYHQVPLHSFYFSLLFFLFSRPSLAFPFPLPFLGRSIPCLFILLLVIRPLIHLVARSFNHSTTIFVKMFFSIRQFFSHVCRVFLLFTHCH